MTGMNPDKSVTERLNFAKVIAFEAGKILMGHFGHLAGYDFKGKVDLVSAADRASEDFLKARILERFPDDAILAEESGASPGASDVTWIIDPLDGTTNFVHGHPMFAVSLAISGPRGVDAGVIYLPVTRELFFAQRGEGAMGPGGRLTVSSPQSLGEALASTGFPYHRREIMDTLLEDVRRLMDSCQGFRRMGSACVDLAYVAAGRYDCYVERHLKPWDTAAGALLVSEAGGRVTNFSGGDFDPFGPELVATNGHTHDELLRVLFDRR
jgi:myo-inositol-1(or 4)-monophosphatase